jgi:hypothetical protein
MAEWQPPASLQLVGAARTGAWGAAGHLVAVSARSMDCPGPMPIPPKGWRVVPGGVHGRLAGLAGNHLDLDLKQRLSTFGAHETVALRGLDRRRYRLDGL